MLVLSEMDKNPYTTLAWSARWTVSVKNARYIQHEDMRDRWRAFRSDRRWIKRCIALNDIVDMLDQMSQIQRALERTYLGILCK